MALRLLGLLRFSVTFEQHCDGFEPALRGVINYQASGALDPSALPDRTIELMGPIARVVYDTSSDLAYGLDATDHRLAKIDLESGAVSYANVTEAPADACVDAARGRLFVANQTSTLITEYRTLDLGLVRSIAWNGTAGDPYYARPWIYCAPDRLYLTDGASPPGLFTVEALDDASPAVLKHGAPGVGRLAFNAGATDLYYWYRDAWNGGWIDTSVHHLLAADFREVDATDPHPPNIYREPGATPIFLDASRSLALAKNKILDATDLQTLVHEMPNTDAFVGGGPADIYAFDARQGLLATMTHVYDLDSYEAVAPRLLSYSIDSFFDRKGRLWSAGPLFLASQIVSPRQ